MLKYEGSAEVPASPRRAMEFISDPRQFARALPGYKGRVRMKGEREFEIDLEITVGPLSGDIVLAGTQEKGEREVVYRGKVTGLNSSFDYVLKLEVREAPSGSIIKWNIEGTLSGLVAMVGESVVERVARRIMEEVVEGTKRELSGAAGGI